MLSIFDLIYIVALISYSLLSIFIVYHIARYSVSKTVMIFTITFFLVGTILLIIANALLFFSVPFESFVPSLQTPSVQSTPTNSPFKK